jgi:hypothetical protein
MISLITKINQITIMPGPRTRRSLMIDVQTADRQVRLEMSEEAAVILRDLLIQANL